MRKIEMVPTGILVALSVVLSGVVGFAVGPSLTAWACDESVSQGDQTKRQVLGDLKCDSGDAPQSATHRSSGSPAKTGQPVCDDKCYAERNAEYNKAMDAWASRYLQCLSAGPTTTVKGTAAAFKASCKATAGAIPKAPKHPRGVDQILYPPTPPDPRVLALEASATLTIPDATPKVGPPPDINKWKMAAVGYPLWLWTPQAGPITKSVTLAGATLTMTARRTSTTFNMGDGHTMTCAATTPWTSSVEPGQSSPTCGYAYQVAVKTKENLSGTYKITATDHWTVSWRAIGSATGTGTIPLQASDGIQLPVGELQSVITGTH